MKLVRVGHRNWIPYAKIDGIFIHKYRFVGDMPKDWMTKDEWFVEVTLKGRGRGAEYYGPDTKEKCMEVAKQLAADLEMGVDPKLYLD